ncbi:MAG: GxxExxY protein [Chloroflexi bacterium]|nr:GxxExxY protein [Chloroflexota bacterium]MCC6894551.1 GxxExxY protein [Anaerolineae bacterium]
MQRREPDKKLDDLAHSVIGAAIEVHRELGPGFLESIYEAALCHELELREIPHVRQAIIQVSYKGVDLGDNRVDLIVDNRLIVELKAVDEINNIHFAQVKSYLKVTNRILGLLINFNVKMLKDGVHRIVIS